MVAKPKILLVWGYHRSGWNKPFFDLRDEFEFHYLFKKFPDKEDERFDFNIRYWSEFSSASEVIEEIKPDKVLFMSIHSPYSISLNQACKRRGITTFFFQHGIESNMDFYLKLERNTSKKKDAQISSSHSSSEQSDPKHALRFLWNSVGIVTFIKSIRLELLTRKMNGHLALHRMLFSARVADYYLVYTRFNGQLHVDRDGVQEDRMLSTGIPEIDPYFEQNFQASENYYLLIDQPLSDNDTYGISGFGISEQDHARMYSKLNDFCLSRGARLKIKLHPDNYRSKRIFEHENTDYLTHSDPMPLILKSKACFGTLSTLMIPAAYFKKVYVLTFYDLPLQKDLLRSGLMKGLDFFTFEPEDIQFDTFSRTEEILSQFVDQYLYQADGKSHRRLAEYLKNVT
ncbi:hypothetical protein KFE98_11410 [bacterium SCSIO 12741]|nr:hypothetical protein KFE98_11410 [bacterium SCSIO 12741]